MPSLHRESTDSLIAMYLYLNASNGVQMSSNGVKMSSNGVKMSSNGV